MFKCTPDEKAIRYYPDDEDFILTVHNCTTCDLGNWCTKFINDNIKHRGYTFWCGKVLADIFLFRGYQSGLSITGDPNG
jgi:hypothetical protein